MVATIFARRSQEGLPEVSTLTGSDLVENAKSEASLHLFGMDRAASLMQMALDKLEALHVDTDTDDLVALALALRDCLDVEQAGALRMVEFVEALGTTAQEVEHG